MDSTIQSLISEINDLSQTIKDDADNETNQEVIAKLIYTTRKLNMALQNHGQLVQEFLFAPVGYLLLKIAVDLGIPKVLVNSNEPKSLKELSEVSGADEVLLGRIMRGLASIAAVEEVETESYRPSKIMEAFTTAKGVAGARLFYDLVQPSWQQTPRYLAQTNYKNPTDDTKLPFHLAFGDKLFFEWVPKQPELLEAFNQYMLAQREGHATWLDFYPVKNSLIKGFNMQDKDAVILVDVGGSMGQEIHALRDRYPDIPGRLILQDLPTTIERLPRVAGIESMSHDFFTPQPVKGARTYYFRSIFHDWNDAKCKTILHQTRAAMKPGYSKLLINDLVVPIKGANTFATHSDFMVMSLVGAMERTERQWEELITSAGLKIDKIWTHDHESESIIEASCIEE